MNLFPWISCIRRASRPAMFAGPVAVLSLALAGAAWCQCRVVADALNFGRQTSFALAGGSAEQVRLSVECTAPTGAYTYEIALAPAHGPGGQRTIPATQAGGRPPIAVELFIDPAMSVRWGDGRLGTAVMRGTAGAPRAVNTHVAYARIPSGQNLQAGHYAGHWTVMLEYSLRP